MADFMGVSKEWLDKQKGILFFENEHFFRVKSSNFYLWNIEKTEETIIQNSTLSQTAKAVLDKIFD